MKKHEMEILEYTVQVKCISVFSPLKTSMQMLTLHLRNSREICMRCFFIVPVVQNNYVL